MSHQETPTLPKLVIDTSTLIHALIARKESSHARQLLRHCFSQTFKPVLSTALLNEYEEKLLTVPHVTLSRMEIENFLDDFLAISLAVRHVGRFHFFELVDQDADDVMVFDLAYFASASIISEDKHLLNMTGAYGVEVYTASQYLDLQGLS